MGWVGGRQGNSEFTHATQGNLIKYNEIMTAVRTQQDATYMRLRQWIAMGKFTPGERLKIHDVAQQLGVGDMPVRAALQRLAAEGALINVPHCGVVVPRLSVAEFDDLLQVRLLLEGDAAERGTLRLTDTQAARLHVLGERMDKALTEHNADVYLEANEAFHILLYKAAGSPMLMNLIEAAWLKVGPISNQLFDTPDARSLLNKAHHEALQAIDKRDCAAVRRAIERDLFAAGQLLRRSCAKGSLTAVPPLAA